MPCAHELILFRLLRIFHHHISVFVDYLVERYPFCCALQKNSRAHLTSSSCGSCVIIYVSHRIVFHTCCTSFIPSWSVSTDHLSFSLLFSFILLIHRSGLSANRCIIIMPTFVRRNTFSGLNNSSKCSFSSVEVI